MDKLIEFVTSKISRATANVYDEKSTSMVSTRLKRRMLELDISTSDEYLSFLQKNYEEEEPILIELLTTHHTFLFREIIHFEYLKENLDRIIENVKLQGRNKIRIWSAAASTGQEAYSLALFLDQELKNKRCNLDFEIIGTDIAPQSIATATEGIYPYDKVKEIPSHYLSGYWERIKQLGSDNAQVNQQIRSKCKFYVHNLLEKYIDKEQFDIIFCRNVFIYFSEENIKKSISNLLSKLEKNGLLFTGVSEPIGSYSDEVAKVGPCIYLRKSDSIEQTIKAPMAESKTYNIVTVDDSPAVLKVLKRIFDEDKKYKLIQQCKDGLELAEFLKNTKEKVDLITLDLHMPNLDGVGYLEKYYNKDHPPVLVVSSVDRDNQDLGQKAVRLGAVDYVEKPNLKNFDECSEELKNKIITHLALADEKVSKPTLEPLKSVSEKTSQYLHSKKLETLPLYVFMTERSQDRILILLEEIFEKGYTPKFFISNSTESVESIKKFVTDFYSKKSQPLAVKNIKFCRNLDFLVSEKIKLKTEDHPIFCMYQGIDVYSHLSEYIPMDSYILSEKHLTNPEHHIDTMPSTSWGFHVLDFLKHDKFTQDTIYNWNDFEGQTHNLSYRCALVVFYKKTTPVAFIEVKNLTNSFPLIKNYLDKKKILDGYKIASPLSFGKKIKSFLDENGLQALNLFKTSGESLYNLKNNLLRIKSAKKTTPNSEVQVLKREPNKKITVLIIDDSITLTKVIKKHIESDPLIECISIHHDTSNLEQSLRERKPDVITLDMNMPDMDGSEIYKRILKKYQIPTILLTSSDKNSKQVLKALELGVLDYIQKPALNELNSSDFPLISRIKDASKSVSKSFDFDPSMKRIPTFTDPNAIILIGASTGGTRAISYLLSSFPKEIPPVVIGQHIPAGYSLSFAELLNEKNPFLVKEAVHGEELKPNTIYIAPGGLHSSIKEEGRKLVFQVRDHVPGATFTPSIDHLFESFSQLKKYNIVATILTGMGKDGAKALGILKRNGAFTLAQDQESSVVYGMPRAAFEMGSAHKQVNLVNMSSEIFDSFSHLNKKAG